MEDKTLMRRAIELINNCYTMTLAVSNKRKAWATPVYYLFHKGNFFFFSSPKSRHIVDGMGCYEVGASIYQDSHSWQEIRGIQMAGKIEMIKNPLLINEVFKKYLKKFPTTKELIPLSVKDITAFLKNFRVKLYCFIPIIIYYLDNEVYFGFRKEINLNEFSSLK